MKMIPLFRVSNMQEAIRFYTEVLDFELSDPKDTGEDGVVILKNDDAEIMLTSFQGDQVPFVAVNVVINDIDIRFQKYVDRGLDLTGVDSPVHLGPLNQTWGTREFYITDKDGNTLRFRQY